MAFNYGGFRAKRSKAALSQAQLREPKSKFDRLNIVLTGILCCVTIYSTWTLHRTFQESRNIQLLERRVAACTEIDRSASLAISEKLREMEGRAVRTIGSLVYGYDYGGYDYGYDYNSGGYTFYDYDACPATVDKSSDCELALIARQERRDQLQRIASSYRKQVIDMEVESNMSFAILGPPELRLAERDLRARLADVMAWVSIEDSAPLLAVKEAKREFGELCARYTQ